MVPRLAIGLAVLAAMTAAGCSAPTAAQLERARAERESLSKVVSQFADAIRNKEPEAASKLLDPELPGIETIGLEGSIRDAVWLSLYDGYSPDLDSAIEGLGARCLLKGRVRFEVQAVSPHEMSIEDEYELVRREVGWRFVDLELQEPLRGEAVSPPTEDEKKIRALLSDIFHKLEQEKPSEVMAMLPNTELARYRPGRRGLLARFLGLKPPIYRVQFDMFTFCETEIRRWPETDEELPLAYVGPLACVAIYDIPYAMPKNGIFSDTMQMELFVAKEEGEWKLELVRFYGEAFPDT